MERLIFKILNGIETGIGIMVGIYCYGLFRKLCYKSTVKIIKWIDKDGSPVPSDTNIDECQGEGDGDPESSRETF